MQHEFVIGRNNQDYWIRFRNISLPFVLLLSLVFILLLLSSTEAILYFSIAYLILIYGLFLLPRRILYRIFFDEETRQVTVDIVEFSRVKHRHIIPFDAFSAVMHYNPMGRDTLWTLKIYANKKLLHKQVVTYGWSKDDFFAIEDLARLYGQPLQ